MIAEFTRDSATRSRSTTLRPIAQIAIDDFMSAARSTRSTWSTPRFINTLAQGRRFDADPADRRRPEQPTRRVCRLHLRADAGSVLESLLPRYVEIQVYQAILERSPREHSARMVAMRNATENAKDLDRRPDAVYNKARQAQITREVSEIAGRRRRPAERTQADATSEQADCDSNRSKLEMARPEQRQIVQVIGPVVDVEFPPEQLPEIYNALEVADGRRRRSR